MQKHNALEPYPIMNHLQRTDTMNHQHATPWSFFIIIAMTSIMLWWTGCTPKVDVQVAPPQEPITINLNVKIDHEVRVKIEKELDEVFSEQSELF